MRFPLLIPIRKMAFAAASVSRVPSSIEGGFPLRTARRRLLIPCSRALRTLSLLPALALWSTVLGNDLGAFAAQSPNFIVIMADDLGFGDVGFNGSTQIPTPQIDRLARSGVVCEQGYVSAPVCSPSRAGFITGRNQVRFGYDNNLAENQPGFDPEYAGLPTDQVTIADRLAGAGYVTGLMGKWHLGRLPQFHPLNRGFAEFWGFLGGGHSYFSTTPGVAEPDIECNYREPEPITYLTDDLGREMAGFVRRHRAGPFFLFCSFNAPHSPMQATDADLELFAGVRDEKRRTYCAMVHRLDVNVGRILDAVEEAGLTRRTLVVFISDNGGPVDQNGSINAPLNGQKGILLEGGIRVPFILSWPGTLPAGTRYSHPVSSLDLAPTFLAAAGVDARAGDQLDGVDLLPYLAGRNTAAPHDQLLWRFTISACVRTGDWKLIRLPDRLPMLYRLSQDISEQHDVAMEHVDRVQTMLRGLGDWDLSLPHPLFLEGAVWKERQRDLYDRGYPLAQPPSPDSPQ